MRPQPSPHPVCIAVLHLTRWRSLAATAKGLHTPPSLGAVPHGASAALQGLIQLLV